MALPESKHVITLSMVSIALSFSPFTFADAPAGGNVAQVIWTKGDVKAQQPSGSPRALQRRAMLLEHDTLTTGADGSGEVSFVDGSVISLNPSTTMKIDDYKFNKNAPAQDKSVMTLVKGGFRTITGAIPKENPDAYKINTPVATIGVRGTEYVTVLSPTKGLLLKVDKGAIEVTNASGKLELNRCDQATGQNNCNRFGVVGGLNIAPAPTPTPPPELSTVTPITPVPAGMGPASISSSSGGGASGGAPAGGAGGGSSGGGTSSGSSTDSSGSTPVDSGTGGASTPSKSVSNFCVGLLQNLYKALSHWFA